MNKLLLLLAAVFLLTAALFKDQVDLALAGWKYAHSPAIGELSSEAFVKRILSQDGKFDPNAKSGVWFNKKVDVPGLELANVIGQAPDILGDSSDGKWIEVDLTKQHLYAHEGNRIVFDFPISSGLPWTPTITGEFHIWAKVKAQRMKGGSITDGSYYDLPNVPFVQYFYNGYGLHGAYWHNDFGKPRSHGCVNISISDSQRLFDWTQPTLGPNEYARYNIKPEESTRVVVHGKTPTNVN